MSGVCHSPRYRAVVTFLPQKRLSVLPGTHPLVCSSRQERRVRGPPFCTVEGTHTDMFKSPARHRVNTGKKKKKTCCTCDKPVCR